jgi:sugar phosphate permease
MFVTGLPVLAPTLQSEFDLSLGQIGVLLAAAWVGSTFTLLPWGLAADRFGERVALSVGLGACAAFLVGAAKATSFGALFVLLALAGAAGSSVNSASGRAVMQWFAPGERGLALGIRQSAIPAGGLIGALVVPPLAEAGGSEFAFLFLAGFCALGALVGAIVLRRGNAGEALDSATVARTLADGKLWRPASEAASICTPSLRSSGLRSSFCTMSTTSRRAERLWSSRSRRSSPWG